MKKMISFVILFTNPKQLTTIFSFIYLLSNTLYAQWEVIHEGWGVNDIFFTSDNTGWMTGSKMLLKTSDGGDSWQTLYLQDDLIFSHIRFFNDTLGLAVAGIQKDIESNRGDYSIFRSEDGGQSWQNIAIPPGNKSDVEFLTDSIFFNIHSETLFRTTDAGQSWYSVGGDFGSFRKLPVFINSTIGFGIVDDKTERYKYIILRSLDSGESWQVMSSGHDNFNYLSNLQFVNDSTGYLGDESHLYVTADTGRHWSTRYSTANGENIGTFGVLTQDSIYAVFSNHLKVSSDGGRSWNVIQELPLDYYYYSSFTFDDQRRGYLISDVPFIDYFQAMVLKQSKDGQWRFLSTAYPFKTLCFVNEEKGFAGGGGNWDKNFSYGDIFRTTDGGKSWELSFRAGIPVTDLIFTDELNGFALTAGGMAVDPYILRTNNGGDSWYRLPEIGHFEKCVFYFKDKKQGWLAGAYYDSNSAGAIIKTTIDGGQTWNTQWKYPIMNGITNSINDLEVVNSVVWVVGKNGLMVKSVNSSSFTVLERQTDLPLNRIFFTDEDHGWVAGGYYDWYYDWDPGPHSVLLRTKDGGQSWQKYSSTEFLINDMFFEDNLHGWVAGADTSGKGIILETADGGESWLTRVNSLRGELKDFYYKDSILWAVGYYGLLLKKEGAIRTDLNNGIKYPSVIQLLQNYPNPFNPLTTITYVIPQTEKVILKIYDILGKEVSTLVNEVKSPGNYEVNFNGSNLASGVYFYRLQAGSFVETKKMVLMK